LKEPVLHKILKVAQVARLSLHGRKHARLNKVRFWTGSWKRAACDVPAPGLALRAHRFITALPQC